MLPIYSFVDVMTAIVWILALTLALIEGHSDLVAQENCLLSKAKCANNSTCSSFLTTLTRTCFRSTSAHYQPGKIQIHQIVKKSVRQTLIAY